MSVFCNLHGCLGMIKEGFVKYSLSAEYFWYTWKEKATEILKAVQTEEQRLKTNNYYFRTLIKVVEGFQNL